VKPLFDRFEQLFVEQGYETRHTKKRKKSFFGYKNHANVDAEHKLIHERAYRNTPLTDSQKEANRKRPQTRVRVEHVFGSQLQLAGDLVIRTIGIVRAKTKMGLRNLSYNLNRYSLLNSKAVAH